MKMKKTKTSFRCTTTKSTKLLERMSSNSLKMSSIFLLKDQTLSEYLTNLSLQQDDLEISRVSIIYQRVYHKSAKLRPTRKTPPDRKKRNLKS